MGKISTHAKEAGRIYHDPGREQRACSVCVDENISFVVIVIFFYHWVNLEQTSTTSNVYWYFIHSFMFGCLSNKLPCQHQNFVGMRLSDPNRFIQIAVEILETKMKYSREAGFCSESWVFFNASLNF